MRLSCRASAAPGIPCLSLPGVHAQAQPAAPGYPVKTVRLVLGYAPGGATDIVAKHNTDFNAVLKLREIRERFAQLGVEPIAGSSDDLERHYRKELATWADVVRDARIERK